MRNRIAYGLALLAAFVLAAPAAAQSNVTGTWAITIQGPEGPAEATATLEQEGAMFSGTISVDQAEGASIENGTVVDDVISFELIVSVQGMDIALQVEGQVYGDMVEGEMFVPDFGGFPFSAQRD